MSLNKKWNKTLFLKEAQEKCMPQEAAVYAKLLEWAEQNGEVRYGTGAVIASFTYLMDGCPVFTVATNGKMTFHFADMEKKWGAAAIARLKDQLGNLVDGYIESLQSYTQFDTLKRAFQSLSET